MPTEFVYTIIRNKVKLYDNVFELHLQGEEAHGFGYSEVTNREINDGNEA